MCRTVPPPAQPITIERLERGLDDLAAFMARKGTEAARFLPIYQRLEDELAALRRAQDAMAAVLDRARRSQDRTAGRP